MQVKFPIWFFKMKGKNSELVFNVTYTLFILSKFRFSWWKFDF